MKNTNGKEILCNNCKGLTLAGMTINITVLLILVGITISLVIGSNVVQTSTVEKTETETIREEIYNAWKDVETEYIQKYSQDSNISKTDYFTEDNLNKYLSGKGTVSSFTYNENGNSVLVYTRTKDNISYQVIIDSKNVVTIEGIVNN